MREMGMIRLYWPRRSPGSTEAASFATEGVQGLPWAPATGH